MVNFYGKTFINYAIMKRSLISQRGDKMKRLVLACILGAFVTFSAGCGSENVLDTYSFGNQVIHAGSSEINVALPFEIGKNTNITQNNEGLPIESYAGMSDHFMVSIQGTQPVVGKTMDTPQALANKSVNVFTQMGGQAQVSPIDLNGLQALKVTATFTDKSNTKESFLQYVFVDKGVLWNIVYQYRTDDVVGAGISKQIEDKIQITH